MEIAHLGHKVLINQGTGCCPTSGFPISKMTSTLGNFVCWTVVKEARRQGGRQDIEVENESVCGKANAKEEQREGGGAELK